MKIPCYQSPLTRLDLSLRAPQHTVSIPTVLTALCWVISVIAMNPSYASAEPVKTLPSGSMSLTDPALATAAHISETSGVRNEPASGSTANALLNRTSNARDSHYLHTSYPLITDVSLTLWEDPDNNGFYSRFSLAFDIDADRYHEAVFARIYLKTDSVRYQLFHTTTHFALRGWAITDYYEMDATLLSEYGSDWYDIRIELFDATTGTLYDSLDAHSHYALFSVPLEARRDYHGNLDVFIQASVGSFGTPVTLLLLLTLLYRHRYRCVYSCMYRRKRNP